MPTRVHAIVLVSKLHKPTLRALAFAKATRPNVLEGVYVSVDPVATNRLLEEWDDRNLGVPLKVLHSPYRELVRPIVEYAMEIKQANPRGVVAVYIPEYVVGRWWEQLLHNQTALRLKGRLLFAPGVMVTSVPYQLRSSQLAREREERAGRLGAADRPADGQRRRAPRDDRPADPADDPATARTATGARRLAGRRAVRGRRRSGRPRRALHRPAGGHLGRSVRAAPRGVRAARDPRRAGRRRDHRGHRGRPVLARRRGRDARGVPGPGRAAVPVRRAGQVRRLRLPARGAAPAARAEGRRRPRAAGPAGRDRRTRRGRAGAGRRQRAALADPDPVGHRRARPAAGCGSTAPATWSRSTTA